jgi:hypothetical protein
MKNKAKIEGFWDVVPTIKKISLELKGKISVFLDDGRIIILPIAKFPSIKKLSIAQRKKWYLFGNGFSFEDCDEVFHIEQILGNYQKYAHEN